MQRRKTRN